MLVETQKKKKSNALNLAIFRSDSTKHMKRSRVECSRRGSMSSLEAVAHYLCDYTIGNIIPEDRQYKIGTCRSLASLVRTEFQWYRRRKKVTRVCTDRMLGRLSISPDSKPPTLPPASRTYSENHTLLPFSFSPFSRTFSFLR